MIACHSLISLAALFFPPVATLFLSVVPDGANRSGVLLRGSSSASTFDVSCCPFLFLATICSLPLLNFGMATMNWPTISGQVRLYKRPSLPLISMAL